VIFIVQNIVMVHGDKIVTLEKHYAELVPNDSQRLAFEKAFRKSAWISSEGTAQPEWLKRPRGSNSNCAMWSSPTNRGFGLSEGSGRWGVVPASEHQEILVALASLIRAQRYEMALTILDNELGI
jgi:hypothetical protein